MKENTRPLILISNDDGYQAKGISVLTDMLSDLADLLVCAPDGPRSGYSCAFTANDPLRLTLQRDEPGLTVYSCSGTPADCVKMALDRLLPAGSDGRPRRPAMVVGGINHGDNGSVNSHYSGTMGVTMEGCMKYIPSVAFSLCDHSPDADFEPMRPYVRDITRRILQQGLPRGVCLNVNFPKAESFRGIKACRMAFGTWYDEVEQRHHQRGYDYYWMIGHYRNDEPEADDTDNWALQHGYIAITPTTIDLTAYDYLQQLKEMMNEPDLQAKVERTGD
ncbi:MAG: 5'/3'-nucleotidase SurE [Prevotella sp.]|nr:5'/3'-nucleotidase SurE [Prevotella sp.]